MPRSTILILDDDEKRLRQFHEALATAGDSVKVKSWRDAPGMVAECEPFLDDACLISLDHDLAPDGSSADAGTGLEVTAFLSRFPKICPVILHTPDDEHLWSMQNELRFAGWDVERIIPFGDDWIPKFWLPRAQWLIAKTKNEPCFRTRSRDHARRMERALVSLRGLSVGDAFGAALGEELKPSDAVQLRLDQRSLPAAPWRVTDDTIMAISVVETLERCGEINRDILARGFVERYRQDPDRGYSPMAQSFLRQLSDGVAWSKAARSAFDGLGSLGNGAAMRVAPLGAYFAGHVEKVVEQATLSAEVSHAHAEAKAGAIGVALAAAWAANDRGRFTLTSGDDLLAFCAEHTPRGPTQQGISRAQAISFAAPAGYAARILGNGSNATAPDTVPFALWCAAKHLNQFADALWTAASGFGDCDTNCAIVGGIVALSAGRAGIPAEWLRAREPLPLG